VTGTVAAFDGHAGLGEIAGDGILRVVAERLRDRLRTTDLVTRAADEFRILLPRGTAAEAMVVARDIHNAVRTAPGGVTCSVGVAPFCDPDDPVAVLHRARAAVDDVRGAGGDGVAAALVAPARV